MDFVVIECGLDYEWEHIERDTGYKPLTSYYDD